MTQRFGLTLIAGLLVALAATPLALAQPAPKDLSQKAEESWDSFKSYTVEKKKEAVATGRKLMRDLDREIKKVEGAASKASGDAKAQMQKEVKALKVQRAEASKKLDAMGKATAEAWDATKNGFVKAGRDLKEATEKAAAKLKS